MRRVFCRLLLWYLVCLLIGFAIHLCGAFVLCSDDGFSVGRYYGSAGRVLLCWWSSAEEVPRNGIPRCHGATQGSTDTILQVRWYFAEFWKPIGWPTMTICSDFVSVHHWVIFTSHWSQMEELVRWRCPFLDSLLMQWFGEDQSGTGRVGVCRWQGLYTQIPSVSDRRNPTWMPRCWCEKSVGPAVWRLE